MGKKYVARDVKTGMFLTRNDTQFKHGKDEIEFTGTVLDDARIYGTKGGITQSVGERVEDIVRKKSCCGKPLPDDANFCPYCSQKTMIHKYKSVLPTHVDVYELQVSLKKVGWIE
ncbi:MAG: hypothetical protein DRI65_11355 [Chloroflexota bacterium]|nr:MAG: hypothetical protein DRI65_11355 [Chloroflexota bacterium]